VAVTPIPDSGGVRYDHPDPANLAQVTSSKLYPSMVRPATRYFGPTRESRDFFTISIS
jgi:hypothetical protein